MTLPALPAQGATSWYPWATGVDSAARNTARTDTDNVFNGDQQVNGRLAVNATADAKQPVAFAATMDGPTVRASGSVRDKVAMAQGILVTGDFTGDVGSNPGFLWGQNVFLATGTDPGDGAGVGTLVGALLEAAVGTPAGVTFGVVRGLEAHASFFGAAAGATVTQMESLRVVAPSRKDGATAGTATNVYGLLVEAVDGGAVGATGSAFSLFVAGGLSRISGSRLDVPNQVTSDAGSVSIFAYYADSNGASLHLDGNSTGGSSGSATVALSKSGSAFQVKNASASVFSVADSGALALTLASTTTAPAAGGAGALPATPAGYATVTINGTARKVAYY